MTSKRLFLKGMREDMRHKVWMLALSLLGSFLAMPVLWLLYYSDVDMASTDILMHNMPPQEQALAVSGSIDRMADFFRYQLMLATGVIAIAGAVIVGQECFRYLQQKSMVDTYHSLPVSRIQLFGIKYVNGLLIWLVPYLLCMILTLVFSATLLARIGGQQGIPALIREAGINTAVLIVVFLLIYHLMLLATMLTGNLLNTLAMAFILGCGVIATYGLGLGFMITYLNTYSPEGRGAQAALYASPMAAPIYLLGTRIGDEFQGLPICLGVALVMGALALFAYNKRPSERAGRGVDLKGLAGILRICVSILGGMAGWLFMYSLVGGSDTATVWGVFGALLMGILTYGVLDVIFSMDFKAFFRHKWSMAVSMVVTLLISFGYRGDWMGYDRYLPEQENIQKVSIACRSYSANRSLSEILEGVELTDAAQIHAFLERGIENVFGQNHKPEEALIEEAYSGESFLYTTDTFHVEVTLANGRSYYRVYPYYKWDEDVVLPLLCSEEYAKGAYYLSEDKIDACINMRFFSGVNNDGGTVETADKEVLREVAEAYNRDLLEQPGVIIQGEDRVLGQLFMRVQQEFMYNIPLDIFEGMTHTLEAMERNDIRIFNQPTEAEEVESITFKVYSRRYGNLGDASLRPLERGIRNYFGVYPDSLPAAGSGAGPRPESGYEPDFEMIVGSDGSEQLAELVGELSTYSFVITDPEEIEELLPLIQYCNMRHSLGVFVKDFVTDVTILDDYGTEWSVCVRRGALPEKYIQRFFEEAEAQ